MPDSHGLPITKEEIEKLVAPIELGPASGEWITAGEALQYVEETCVVARTDAIRAICRRVPVPVPVSCVSWSVGEDPHDYIDRAEYFRGYGRTNDHFMRSVSQRAFQEIGHFFEAVADGDTREGDWLIEYASWETGDFKVHLERDFSVVRLGVVGLQFDRVALEKSFTGKMKAALGTTATNGRGSGGRPQSAAWPQWIAELVNHVHVNGFPEGEGSQGQEALIKAVADRLAERGLQCPSRTTVQAAVQAVLDRLRAI